MPLSSRALLAGAPPDSAAARVDPNVAASPWTGAVSLVIGGSPYSGVAIAPQYVLTASHVAAGVAPAAIQVVVNASATPLNLAVGTVTTYPGASFPYDDLTLLRLAQPLPAGVAVYPIVDTVQPVGTVITLVGYGASGNGATGPTVAQSSTVKRTGRNVVDQLTQQLDTSGRKSPFFIYDFDGPSGNGPLGGGTLGNAVETTVAGGDSGSGVYIDSGFGPALYGLSTVTLNLNGSSSGTFSSGGGGLVLAHQPYLDWLQAQTGGTVQLLSTAQHSGDVPAVPGWMLAMAATGFVAQIVRGRSTRPT